jgi:hypothetical protein
MNSTIDTVIDSLIELHCQSETDLRQRHLFRESLRGLVRLAQAEQMWEIKSNVRTLTDMSQAQIKRQASRILKSTGEAKTAKEQCERKRELDPDSTCSDDPSRLC